MKKKQPYYGFILLALLALFVTIYFSSCDPNGPDIWHDDSEPTDTIAQEPIVDTCLTYQELTNVKWCSWAINLDGLPATYQFYLQTGGKLVPINLDSFLAPYNPVEYFSGVNICGIITGIDAPTWVMNHHLYTKDAFDRVYLLTFNKYLFVFNGALTFDQFYNELVNRSNFTRLGFWNTGFECDQYNTIIDYIIDNCIEGNGNIIDLRHIHSPCEIDQERIDRLKLAHFEVLQ